MSTCECYQVGGPFIAEDPDCVIHGFAHGDRTRNADRLFIDSQQENVSVDYLRDIVAQLHIIITEIG